MHIFKFKKGDIVKCEGSHFAVREILECVEVGHRYRTKFIEDDSIVESCANIIDENYIKISIAV